MKTLSISNNRFLNPLIKSNQAKMLRTSKNRIMASVIGITALCMPLSSCFYQSDKELLSSGPVKPDPNLYDVFANDTLEIKSRSDSVKTVDFHSKFYKLINFLNVKVGTICMRKDGCREYFQDGIYNHKALFCDETDSGFSCNVYLTNHADNNTLNLVSKYYLEDLSKTEEITLKDDTLYISRENKPVTKIYKTDGTNATQEFVYNTDGISGTVTIRNESFPYAITFNAVVEEY